MDSILNPDEFSNATSTAFYMTATEESTMSLYYSMSDDLDTTLKEADVSEDGTLNLEEIICETDFINEIRGQNILQESHAINSINNVIMNCKVSTPSFTEKQFGRSVHLNQSSNGSSEKKVLTPRNVYGKKRCNKEKENGKSDEANILKIKNSPNLNANHPAQNKSTNNRRISFRSPLESNENVCKTTTGSILVSNKQKLPSVDENVVAAGSVSADKHEKSAIVQLKTQSFVHSIFSSSSAMPSNGPRKSPRLSIIPKSAMPTVNAAPAILNNRKSSTLTSRKSLLPPKQTTTIPKKPQINFILKNVKTVISTSVKLSAAEPAQVPLSRKSTYMPRKSLAVVQKETEPKSKPNAQKPSELACATTSTQQRRSIFPSVARKSLAATTAQSSYECDVCHKKFRLTSNLAAHKRTHDNKLTRAIVNKCRYCDKTFTLSTALDYHIREYCAKVPVLVRKKLLSQHEAAMAESSSNSMSGSDSISSIFSDTGVSTRQSYKAKPAHTGVHWTPRKDLMCKQCEKRFYNIFSLKAHTDAGCHHVSKK